MNSFTSPADVAAGGRLFQPLCSNCHGQDGRGVEGLAPGLAGELHRASSDRGVFEVIWNGIGGTDMPAFTFDERQTWQLVSFIRSLRNKAHTAQGDPAAGETLFREQGCANCHGLGEKNTRQGPDLREAAAIQSPDELRTSILRPGEKVHPRHFRVRAATSEGETVEGLRLNEDSYSLQILGADARLVSLDKEELNGFELVTESPMPSFEGRLSGQQLDDLIAYLYRLAAGDQP